MINGALAMEGGSLRCLFTAGVVDVLMENHIDLSYVIGVSAGSLTGANYVAKQPGRTAEINFSFVNDKRYLGLRSLVKNRMIFNFNFLFGEISKTLLPFDFETFLTSPTRFVCVATDCETGEPHYFERGACADIFEAMKASSSMPMVSKMIELEGKKHLDGGCSLAIPFQKPIEEGYEKILVITTRPRGFRKMPVSRPAARAYMTGYRGYPNLVSTLMNTPRMYAKQMRDLDRLEQEERLLVVRPRKPISISRTEKDTEKLRALYEEGRAVGLDSLPRIRAYFGVDGE